ncbi:cyclase family protein [Elusimicrobiota bacterium]
MSDKPENRKYIDISVALKPGMVHYPGDKPFGIEYMHDMNEGDSNNLSAISMGSHSGTHIDAPKHFLKDGSTIDNMPVDNMIGPARVVIIENEKVILREELRGLGQGSTERILFKTKNSDQLWNKNEFSENFVCISEDAARYIAGLKVKMIGIDYLSAGPYHGNGSLIHRILLDAGIWIVEGLNLSGVAAGEYQLICLPLKITGAEGSPARAVLIPL